MKIIVAVKASAKEEKVEKADGRSYKVWVKAPAKEGKANRAVIAALAKHFGVAKLNVEIIAGRKAKNKVVKIDQE